MPASRINFLTNLTFIFWVYVLVAAGATLHRYFLGPDHYGNYLIFKNSFTHLLAGTDLYASYPELKLDLYKYSPTFAVLFSPFTLIPDAVGVVVWNSLNALLLLFSIRLLNLDQKRTAFILWFILIELITSLQNCQSNALTASLVIFVFTSLERKRYILAGVCAAAGFYIKLFGVLGVLFWLFYPGKGKFFLSALLSLLALFALPLLFVSVDSLAGIYGSWFNLLSTDPSHELNHSVMSVLRNWFGWEVNKVAVQAAGAVLLLFPLLNRSYLSDGRYRLLFLCSVLIWSVIFNHKAESATYIIAVAGCAIWFFTSGRKPVDIGLVLFLFLLTSLSPTDLFPKYVRENYIVPYSLKALPCILIWIRIQYDLLAYRGKETAN